MEKYFSIGEAARAVGTTTETLRHYDRIGLVKPSRKDEWTGYRYYTEKDVVLLNTVRALQVMDLSLQEIKRVLAYDDLEKIVAFFDEAEKRADKKIALLQNSKAKIRLARADYEKKLETRKGPAPAGGFVRELPERVILLSDTLETPTLDNLWNYLSHFYEKVTPARKAEFAFEDLAGIYTEGGRARLFAVCTRYGAIDGLRVLAKGRYLCADCTEENRRETLDGLLGRAGREYGVVPPFTVQIVVISGVLQWNYQIQIPLWGG